MPRANTWFECSRVSKFASLRQEFAFVTYQSSLSHPRPATSEDLKQFLKDFTTFDEPQPGESVIPDTDDELLDDVGEEEKEVVCEPCGGLAMPIEHSAVFE